MNAINNKLMFVENLAVPYNNSYIVMKTGKYGKYISYNDFKCSFPKWALDKIDKNELTEKDVINVLGYKMKNKNDLNK